MSEKHPGPSQPDWEAFRHSMGYSPEELAVFRSKPNNEYVVQHASRLDGWLVVAEIIESQGCATGHKIGDKFILSPHGVLIAEKSPPRICLQTIPALASAVAVFAERIIAGLEPNPYLFRRVGCVDVGVKCGGWGHVAFELYAVPNEQG
jgi:hypothetical protein